MLGKYVHDYLARLSFDLGNDLLRRCPKLNPFDLLSGNGSPNC